MQKPKVLILIQHYLPGYKFGGPLNSILSITKSLKTHYNFFILTSDRDLGDDKPYENIVSKTWVKGVDCPIMYLPTGLKFYYNLYSVLKQNQENIIYLNSFFSFKFSIYIIFLNFMKCIKLHKVIIAPRGELYQEALDFGRFKKLLFLKLSKSLGFYSSVIWHSTNDSETLTIDKYFKNANIKLAKVLADTTSDIVKIQAPIFKFENDNVLKAVYISRISKDKNLIYALRILSQVKSLVEFHIYGPIEDTSIWQSCLEEIKSMPSNVIVEYKGVIEKQNVKSYFSFYDIFIFPTFRENFGHVINESLSVGTPVLVSNNTPWRNLTEKKLGWDLNLDHQNLFIDVIQEYSNKTKNQKNELRYEIINAYQKEVNCSQIITENINLFI